MLPLLYISVRSLNRPLKYPQDDDLIECLGYYLSQTDQINLVPSIEAQVMHIGPGEVGLDFFLRSVQAGTMKNFEELQQVKRGTYAYQSIDLASISFWMNSKGKPLTRNFPIIANFHRLEVDWTSSMEKEMTWKNLASSASISSLIAQLEAQWTGPSPFLTLVPS